MSSSAEFVSYVLDQLAKAGDVTHRKMFGGVGIYVDGVFCAIIGSSDRFYLRVGSANIGSFEDEGMRQFEGREGATMPYYEVPEHVLEDAGELAQWAREAKAAAVQSKKK